MLSARSRDKEQGASYFVIEKKWRQSANLKFMSVANSERDNGSYARADERKRAP